MGIAGAAFGAGQTLEKILAEQMVQAQLAQRERENAERMALEQARLAETVKQNEIGNQRDQRIDDERATERRRITGISGIRRMMADAVTQGQGPMSDQDRRGFAALQIEAGDDPTAMLNPPKVERDPIADHRAKAEIDAEFRPRPTAPRVGTHVVGGSLVDDTGKVLFTDPNKAKTGDGEKASPYAVEHSRGVVRKINDLIGDPANPNSKSRINSRTAGVGGALLSKAPWQTAARDVNAELGSLAANLAFEQLQKMREASKTGGALGQVSNVELDLLQNAQASIRQDQSPANLQKQLGIIRESAQRFLDAAERSGGLEPMAPVVSTPRDKGGPSRVDELLKKYGGTP